MLLYKDIITGSEMFSDAFPIKLIDDIVYEVDCQMITVKAGADVNIGANPSQEEQDEALEEGASQVNNVVHSFRLQTTVFTKPDYTKHLKEYMKLVKEHLETNTSDRVASFQAGAQTYVNKLLAEFNKYDFYTGDTAFDGEGKEGMVALLNYRKDGITPYFTFWKDGLKEEKL